MAFCQHRVGFLILKDCGEAATALCQLCNRPVCLKHKRLTEDGTIVCTECFLADDERMEDEEMEDGELEADAERGTLYREAGYVPFYLGASQHRFGNESYRQFDADAVQDGGDSADGLAEELDEPMDPTDFLDS